MRQGGDGDKIMGWKEEQRAKGISEEDIARGLAETQKAIEAEGGPPDLEAIKKRITGPETSPVVKEPPPKPGDWSKGDHTPLAFDLNSTNN
jgi:hypothetical protein